MQCCLWFWRYQGVTILTREREIPWAYEILNSPDRLQKWMFDSSPLCKTLNVCIGSTHPLPSCNLLCVMFQPSSCSSFYLLFKTILNCIGCSVPDKLSHYAASSLIPGNIPLLAFLSMPRQHPILRPSGSLCSIFYLSSPFHICMELNSNSLYDFMRFFFSSAKLRFFLSAGVPLNMLLHLYLTHEGHHRESTLWAFLSSRDSGEKIGATIHTLVLKAAELVGGFFPPLRNIENWNFMKGIRILMSPCKTKACRTPLGKPHWF